MDCQLFWEDEDDVNDCEGEELSSESCSEFCFERTTSFYEFLTPLRGKELISYLYRMGPFYPCYFSCLTV